MSVDDKDKQEEQLSMPFDADFAFLNDIEHPADIADELQRESTDDVVKILAALPVETASEVLGELDCELASRVINSMEPVKAVDLLEELPPDETADILSELRPSQRYEVLAHMPPEESAKVADLLRYPEDSAGGIMTDYYITLPRDLTIDECQQRLHEWVKEEEDVEEPPHLFVVDKDSRLVGIIRVRDLVFRKPERVLKDVMDTDVKYVRADDDQETVARLFEQYHYLSLPVLESDGRLVGVIEADTVIDVIQEEATEDMQLMVGVSGEERSYTPWYRATVRRLPWLYVNTCTAFIAATVISLFEGTIAKWTVLAVFLPIVAGQGGNAGMQTLTVIIRGMALGEISAGEGRSALAKELIIGVINGIAVGVVVGCICYLWKGNYYLGMIITLAMLMNMISAALFGALIPLGLKALKIDPALASSIFLTAVTDAGGFLFLLGFATLAMRVFGII